MQKSFTHTREPESGYPDTELLRFTTAGSFEDGKSTLTSRLLQHSEHLSAHRRKFIIADMQNYNENISDLIPGDSTADAAILLVDARQGILEQTKRYSYIASLLKIPNVILAINKMDLVGYSEEVYIKIKQEYGNIASRLAIPNYYCIPTSAKDGDNVVDRSENTPWYSGNTLLEILETIPVYQVNNDSPARFPVRHVIRSKDDTQYESSGYTGRLSSGTLKVGDSLLVIPGNRVANIKAIYEGDKQLQQAFTAQLIDIQLTNNLHIETGSMFVKLNEKFPKYSSKVTLIVCWLNQKGLKTGFRYIVRHTTDETVAVIESIRYKVNLQTLENSTEDKNVALNDIAHITIKAEKPFKYDDYSENRTTGSLVFIDESTFETVGAGMIVSDPEVYSYNI